MGKKSGVIVKVMVVFVLLAGFTVSASADEQCVDPDDHDPDNSGDWYDQYRDCPLTDSASWDVPGDYDGGSLSATAELDWSNPTPVTYYGNDILIGNQDLYMQVQAGVYDCQGGSATNYRDVYPWSSGWGGGGFDADGTYTRDISTSVDEGDGVHYVILNVAVDSGSPGPDGARTTPTYHKTNAIVTNTGTDCGSSNNPPNADISANTTTVMEGGTVEFDPSGSNDVDGSISEYQYEWPDGGATTKYSSSPHAYTFNTPGTRTVELQVKDDDGATDSTTIDINVEEECSFSVLKPDSKTVVQGDDTYFTVYHNDAPNCPSASDMKLDVCGTNLTSSDGLYETSDYYTPTLQTAFNISFNTQTDVSCSSATNPVQFYNQDEPVGWDADLDLTRGKTFGAPIHDNGDYKPDSEIIVATEMSHPRTDFYNLGSQNVADMEDTFFFACRGDYRGTNISDSKLVKVQKGSLGAYRWQHYRCAMNGSWTEVNCQPGRELRFDDQDDQYECFLKASQTIEATYFNILDVPYSGRDNGYLAGFKIPESEIAKYEQVMGFEPQKVDAECWMGEDNERPSNSDDSVVFTSTYDGNGDLWAIGNVKGRDGVNNETYSCVWGMKNVGSTAETNVYESTNNDPLLARDGGKQDITYNTIESRYSAADIEDGTPRNVWADYQHPDDGGEDERTYALQNHFMLNGEYPYCSGNSFFSSNPERTTNTLNNIICQGSGGYGGIS